MADKSRFESGTTVEQTDELKTAEVTTGAGTSISVRFRKIGRVATVKFTNGSYTANANTTLITFPTGFEPLDGLDFQDTYASKRIQVSTNGTMTCGETLSNINLRGAFTYLTKQ